MQVPLKGNSGGGGGGGDHDPKVTSFLRVARNGDKNKLIDLIKENCDIINASNHVRIVVGPSRERPASELCESRNWYLFFAPLHIHIRISAISISTVACDFCWQRGLFLLSNSVNLRWITITKVPSLSIWLFIRSFYRMALTLCTWRPRRTIGMSATS